MFSINHLLLPTVLISLTGAFVLEEREKNEEMLKEREKNKEILKERESQEVLIVTGGFSSQGALSSVEVLDTKMC